MWGTWFINKQCKFNGIFYFSYLFSYSDDINTERFKCFTPYPRIPTSGPSTAKPSCQTYLPFARSYEVASYKLTFCFQMWIVVNKMLWFKTLVTVRGIKSNKLWSSVHTWLVLSNTTILWVYPSTRYESLRVGMSCIICRYLWLRWATMLSLKYLIQTVDYLCLLLKQTYIVWMVINSRIEPRTTAWWYQYGTIFEPNPNILMIKIHTYLIWNKSYFSKALKNSS